MRPIRAPITRGSSPACARAYDSAIDRCRLDRTDGSSSTRYSGSFVTQPMFQPPAPGPWNDASQYEPSSVVPSFVVRNTGRSKRTRLKTTHGAISASEAASTMAAARSLTPRTAGIATATSTTSAATTTISSLRASAAAPAASPSSAGARQRGGASARSRSISSGRAHSKVSVTSSMLRLSDITSPSFIQRFG